MYTLNITPDEMDSLENNMYYRVRHADPDTYAYRAWQEVDRAKKAGPVPKTFVEFVAYLDGGYSDWQAFENLCFSYGVDAGIILTAMKKAAGI